MALKDGGRKKRGKKQGAPFASTKAKKERCLNEYVSYLLRLINEVFAHFGIEETPA